MGMFDRIHTEKRCGQVKCLGKALRSYRIGDEVQLHRLLDIFESLEVRDALERDFPSELRAYDGTPAQKRAYNAYMDDPRSDRLMLGDPLEVFDYQIVMRDGGFLQVRSARLIDWTAEPAYVPCYDNGGRVADPLNLATFGPRYFYDDPDTGRCSDCQPID